MVNEINDTNFKVMFGEKQEEISNKSCLKFMTYSRKSKLPRQPKPKYKDGQNGAVERSQI